MQPVPRATPSRAVLRSIPGPGTALGRVLPDPLLVTPTERGESLGAEPEHWGAGGAIACIVLRRCPSSPFACKQPEAASTDRDIPERADEMGLTQPLPSEGPLHSTGDAHPALAAAAGGSSRADKSGGATKLNSKAFARHFCSTINGPKVFFSSKISARGLHA